MLLVVVLLLGIGVALLVHATASSTALALEQDRKTRETLAQVKQALIGWSASRDPAAPGSPASARPGELPCPDFDNDGLDNGACTAGAIGRVPWKTLSIPEPKDAAGETIWYAIAGPFRNFSMVTTPITSDTLGNMTVHQDSTANTITNQAIAVIFAAGMSVGPQDRSSTATALCPTTGTTIARNLCARNYLEAAGGVDNAVTNGPFISAQSTVTFNDKVLVITAADLMPLVEQRVARSMQTLLLGYRTATATSALFLGGIYPWADVGDGNSNDGTNRGRFPCGNATPVGWNTLVPLSLPPTNTPSLPAWLTNGCGLNGWASVVYYTSGRNFLDILNLACSTCTAASLSVDGVAGHELVLLTPGAATGARAWVSGYFEDAQNNDNANDSYVTPTSTAYDRDRLLKVP